MALGGSGTGGGGSAGAVRAGRGFFEVTGNDAQLRSVLDRAAARVKRFGATISGVGVRMAAAGGAMLAPAIGATAKTVDDVTTIGRLGSKLDVPVEKLSAFAYAAETTGQDLEKLSGHFENWVERVGQASFGTGEAIVWFNRLGISAQKLKQMDSVDQLIELADAMEKVTNSTDRRTALSAFGGDQFQWLNDLLKLGSGGIRSLMDQAGGVGAVVSPADVENAKAVSKAWLDIKTSVMAVVRSAVFAILPSPQAVREFATWVVAAVGSVRQWVSDNRALVAGVVGVGAALLVAGAAFAAFGGFVSLVGAGIGGLVAAFAVVKAVVATLLSAAFMPLGTIMAGLGVAAAFLKTAIVGAFTAVLSPVGLTVLAIGGLAYAFATQTQAGRTATSEIGKLFTDLKDTAATAWGGIVNAIQAGDLALAGKVAVAGLDVAWKSGLAKMAEGWVWFKGQIVDGWRQIVRSLAVGMNNTVSGVKGFFAEAVGVLDFSKTYGEAKADAERKKAEYEQDRQAVNREIDADFRRTQAEAEVFRQRQVADAKADLNAARQELNQLVGQARQKAEDARKAMDNAYKPGAGGDLPIMKVVGAYRAPDWRQLFGGTDVPKEQLKVAKDQLKEEKKGNDILGEILQQFQQYRGGRFI